MKVELCGCSCNVFKYFSRMPYKINTKSGAIPDVLPSAVGVHRELQNVIRKVLWHVICTAVH